MATEFLSDKDCNCIDIGKTRQIIDGLIKKAQIIDIEINRAILSSSSCLYMSEPPTLPQI